VAKKHKSWTITRTEQEANRRKGVSPNGIPSKGRAPAAQQGRKRVGTAMRRRRENQGDRESKMISETANDDT